MITTSVKRAYKYRFFPDAQQEHLLLRTFGCARLVYNKALQERRDAWKNEQRSVSYNQSAKLLTAWKQREDLAFLREVSNVALQQALRQLDGAYQRFFSKQNAHPRFKKKRTGRKSATFTRSGFRYDAATRALRLAKCDKPLEIGWSRELPEGVQPSSVTVSLDSAGRWFISILVEEEIQRLDPVDRAVGLDLGLETLIVGVDTDGAVTKIQHPRITKKHAAKLARAQREAARRVKGSKNREKSLRKVARIHAKIADQRRDHLHKVSTQLVRENQTIVLEDLAVQNMSRSGGAHKKGLNRSIADAGWSELRSMLEYKSAWYGRDLVIIDRWFPSSQLCSSCGLSSGKKPLGVRAWSCLGCGTAHDRDENAARNILAAGLAVTV